MLACPTEGMVSHSFIRVDPRNVPPSLFSIHRAAPFSYQGLLAYATRNLTTRNSRELVARKNSSKITNNNLAIVVQITQEFSL
jgi:hypothetical protein